MNRKKIFLIGSCICILIISFILLITFYHNNKSLTTSVEKVNLTYENFIKDANKFDKYLQEIKISKSDYDIQNIYSLQYLINIDLVDSNLFVKLIEEKNISRDFSEILESAYQLINIITNKSLQNEHISLLKLCHGEHKQSLAKYLTILSKEEKDEKLDKHRLNNFYQFMLGNESLQYYQEAGNNSLYKYNKLNNGDKFMVNALTPMILVKATNYNFSKKDTNKIQNEANKIEFISNYHEKLLQALENKNTK